MMTKFIMLGLVFLLSGCVEGQEEEAGAGEVIEAEDAGVDASIQLGVQESLVRDKKIEAMSEEIVDFWNMIFDDDNIPKISKRRRNFRHLARVITEYVEFFKSHPKYPLPDDRKVHLLIAYMAFKESSLMPNVRGSRGEVGYLQIQKEALQGYRPAQILRNPNLGLFLGIRWLAKSLHRCKLDIGNWNFRMWFGPLAMYGGGKSRAMKHGRCATNWKFSRERVLQTEVLYERLLAQKQKI